LASARAPKFSWSAGDEFEAELWLLNDSPQAVPAGCVEVVLQFATERVVCGEFRFPVLAARENFRGPTVRCRLPVASGPTFELNLRVAERAELDSRYTFASELAGPNPRSTPAPATLNV
jgi:beta-mannosidase